jgi:hypothetical protein
MAQTFEYTLAGDPARKLEQVRAAAAAKGVIFSGDLNGGQFSGRGLIGEILPSQFAEIVTAYLTRQLKKPVSTIVA